MNKLFPLFFLCILQPGFSQNWQWSKTTGPFNASYYYASNRKIVTDIQGNAYVFTSSNYQYYSSSPDSSGTFLQVYSPSGALLSSKHWNFPFSIQDLVYDGNNSLYFAAVFFGNLAIDGIAISSMGCSDGVIGQMNLNGTILWMRTYGGKGCDKALSICRKKNSPNLFVGGEICDTLYFDHTFNSVNSQSALLCEYTNNGQRVNHRVYDFTATQSGYSNSLVDIGTNSAGELIALMDRDGENWNNYPYQHPVMGRYMIKFNTNLDTLWSTFIIGPGCYYGWVCSGLEIAANGDAYVASYCSSHYGGDGRLNRINGNTGVITWSHSNPDGVYTGLAIDSNTVYVVGNEGAVACPCQGNDPGYYVVKIFDENNNTLGETQCIGTHLNAVACSGNNDLYVFGQLIADTVHLGPDMLTGSPQNMPSFISKLSKVNCAVPTVNVSGAVATYYHDHIICPGGNATLAATGTQGNFTWSNGVSGVSTNVSATGSYYVKNDQPTGCTAYSLPVHLTVNTNNGSHKVLMVSYDATLNRNTIIASITDYQDDISQINLLKDVNGTPTPVGTLTGTAIYYAALTDTLTDPTTRKVDYYLSTVDTCGNTSPLSPITSSIFLSLSKDNNNRNVLTWNTGTLLGVQTFRILRGNSRNSLTYITSVAAGQGTYTDLNNTLVNTFYQIEAVTYYITINGHLYQNSFSNIVDAQNTPFAITDLLSEEFLSVYPNPVQKELSVNYKAVSGKPMQLSIRNLFGELVFSETLEEVNGEYKKEIELAGQPQGMYMLEVSVADKKISRKIVKQN